VEAAEHRLPRRPRHPGRSRVGEPLSQLPGALRVRRVQVLGHRAGEPPDDARPLPADEEPAGQLLGTEARLLLSSLRPARPTGRSALRVRRTGPHRGIGPSDRPAPRNRPVGPTAERRTMTQHPTPTPAPQPDQPLAPDLPAPSPADDVLEMEPTIE